MPPRFQILLPTTESADEVGIVEISVPPGWEGPPLHRHDFDESFYVLDGAITFQIGETLQTGVAGDLVFAPRGAIHTLANLGELPARYLLVCTPGSFTNYFEQLNGTRENASYPETIVVGPTIREGALSRSAPPARR
jgi:quercetin dioxygenase-like cupin family protein